MGWEVIEETLQENKSPTPIQNLWREYGVWFEVGKVKYFISETGSDW